MAEDYRSVPERFVGETFTGRSVGELTVPFMDMAIS
jgi:hypothetical protein